MARTSPAWTGLEELESRQLLAAVSWDGGGGDLQWDNPLNWSGDVLPGPGDDVVINVAGAPTIHHSDSAVSSVHSLWSLDPVELSAGTISVATQWRAAAPLMLDGGRIDGTGDLVVNTAMTWTAGTIAGSGRVQFLEGRSLDIAGGGSAVVLSRTLVNNGTLLWESGDISAQGATIINLLGRLFEMRSGGTISSDSGTNVLSNFGVVRRTGDAATVSTVEMRLNNIGVVDARSGTLRIAGSVVQVQPVPEQAGEFELSGGTWWVTSSAGTLDLPGRNILNVVGGGMDGTQVRLIGAGAAFPQLEGVQEFEYGSRGVSLILAGGRAYTFSRAFFVQRLRIENPGVTVIASGDIQHLEVAGGPVRVTGAAFISGFIGAGSELDISGPVTLGDIAGPGLLRIQGTATWFGGTWTGGSVLVEAGATLNMESLGILMGGQSGLDNKVLARRLVNYGRVEWSDLTGTLALAAEFVNRGAFVISGAGYLSTGAGVGFEGATSFISNYGTIEKTGMWDVVLRGAGGGVRLANFGTVHVLEGRLVANGGGLSSGTFTVDSGAEFAFGGLAGFLSGATLAGTGTIRVANDLVWSGISTGSSGPRNLIVGTAGRLRLDTSQLFFSGSTTITNNGVFALAAGARVGAFGSMVNNGVLDLDADSVFETGGMLTLSSTSVLKLGISDAGTFGHLGVYDIMIGGRLNAKFAIPIGAGVNFNFIQVGHSAAGAFSSVSETGLALARGAAFSLVGTTDPGVVEYGNLRVV